MNTKGKRSRSKKILCIILSMIIGFGTFVSMTFGNLFLSDYIDLRDMITARASVITPVPIFYRHGELVGLYRVNYSDNTQIQYKIGEDGEWTDYSVPFSIPAHQTTKVYARIGADGRATYMNISNTDYALGVYSEGNTDFEFSYNNIDFGYTRIYNSVDKNWFESIHSKALVTNSRLEVTLPDSSIIPMIRKDADTYVDELNGYTLIKENNNYIFDDGQYKYYFAIKALQSVSYLSAIEDYSGNRLNLNRTANSEEIAISDGVGRSFALSDYQSIEAPDGSGVNYYSQKEITDPNGNKIKYTTKFSRYIQVKDQAGVILGEYEYKSPVDYTLIKSTDKSIDYYENGRLKQITYNNGAWIKYTYDDANMLYTTLTSSGETTKTVYNDAFYPVEYTDEYGETTTYTYDDHYRVLTETCGTDTTTYTYDSEGNVVSFITDDAENDTYYTYDSDGNVIREQTGTAYTYYTYDSNKNVLVNAVLKEGYEGEAPESYDSSLTCFDTVSYTYDAKGRVTKEENSDGSVYQYEYDSSGNVLKETSTVVEDAQTETTVTTYTYDELGNVLTTQCDNENASYIYDNAGRTLLSNDNGSYSRTLYDDYGRVIQEITDEDYDSAKDGLPEANTYADKKAGHRYVYDNTTGNLTSETNRIGVKTDYEYYSTGEKKKESFDIYDYIYNVKGNLTKVYVNGVNTITYIYNEDNQLTSEAYANGQSVRYEYDNNRNLIAQYRNDETKPYAEFIYNDNNELEIKINNDDNSGMIYNEDGSIEVYNLSTDSCVMTYSRTDIEEDEENGIEAEIRTEETHFGTEVKSYRFVDEILYESGNIIFDYINSEKDNRLDTETITSYNASNNTSKKISTKYSYDAYGNATEKNLLIGRDQVFTMKNSYDDEGNIVGAGYDDLNIHYSYDSTGQLVRVDDNVQHYTAMYEYDGRGNFVEKNEYAYTRNENISTAPVETTQFFPYYNDFESSSFDAYLFVKDEDHLLLFDEVGNVVSYEDKTFTWTDGRKLSSITDGENEYSYTYDENGIRTSKTVNGVTTYYNTIDGVILSQSDGENTLYFQYDLNGIPSGFIHNGTQYFYITNLQGDVLSICDSKGNPLVEYEYDEWGKVTFVIGIDSSSRTLANLNPLRYRGYYYDNETGYYYLQSRYYDPSICRFINADVPEIAQAQKDEYIGTNLFAYCCNDPVNNIDPTGFFAKDYHKDQTFAIAIIRLAELVKKLFKYSLYRCDSKLNYLATRMAQGAYDVDKNYPSTKKFYSKYNQSFHFNVNSTQKNKEDSRITRYKEFYKKAIDKLDSAKKVYKKDKIVCFKLICDAFYYFGMSLHPRQDMISHSGKGGNLYYSNLVVDENGNLIPMFYYHLPGYDNPNWKYLNTNSTKGEVFIKITLKLINEFYKAVMSKGF